MGAVILTMVTSDKLNLKSFITSCLRCCQNDFIINDIKSSLILSINKLTQSTIKRKITLRRR